MAVIIDISDVLLTAAEALEILQAEDRYKAHAEVIRDIKNDLEAISNELKAIEAKCP
jgi:hypothetical protein